jgi:hypothetical protein
MELALATRKVDARSALTVAAGQLLLLIALGYAIACLVPACFSVPSPQANEELRSGIIVPSSDFKLYAELVCESAPPRLWERSACNLPK